MKLQTTLLVSAVRISGAYGQYLNMDIVLRSGETVDEMDEGDFPTFRNGKCTIRYPRDGNWATQNGFNVGGWDSNGKSLCQSSHGPGAPTLSYTLKPNGNFVAHCGYQLDYATHSGGGPIDGKYFMAIDDDCILHTYRGTFDCDSISIEKGIWSNVKHEPLQRGDLLRQGQFVRDEVAGTSLLMQSVDGNLVLYQDNASGPEGNVLWAAMRNGAMVQAFLNTMNTMLVLPRMGI